MISPELGAVILPDRLYDLASETDQLIGEARALEEQINAYDGTLNKKKELAYEAIALLDDAAKSSFFGERVEIEGGYKTSKVVRHAKGSLFEDYREHGVARGLSHGFTFKVLKFLTEAEMAAGKFEEGDGDYVQLCHLVVADRASLYTPTVDIPNYFPKITAAVNESSLKMVAVEDYRNTTFARAMISGKRKERRWADSIDEILFGRAEPDLRSLGRKLIRMSQSDTGKLDDYLSYINQIMSSDGNEVHVYCDDLISYQNQSAPPEWIRYDNLVIGDNQGICFTGLKVPDSVLFHPAKGAPKGEYPVMGVRTNDGQSDTTFTIHIPLTSVHSVSFI